MIRLEAPVSRQHFALLGLSATLALLLALTLPGESPGAPVPRCDGTRATIVGNSRANTLQGTEHRDVIVGLGGRDTINGRGGNDLICGGTQRDILTGGDDEDRLIGQSGQDDLFGSDKDDRLEGGPGPDGLAGGDGDDKIFGGEKDDDLFGGTGIDLCDPGPGPSDQTVAECEADLRLDLSGPSTAPAGLITYTVTVRNNGPSPVSRYTLDLHSDNHHLQCDTFFDDTELRPALAVGQTRVDKYSVDCVLEGDPPRTVSFQAGLSAVSPATDPHPGNNSSVLASTDVG